MELKMGLKNCRVLIKDAVDNVALADTRIANWDVNTGTAWVDDFDVDIEKYTEVVVLVFKKDGLCEYQGTIQSGKIADKVRIQLYQGREKEDRTFGRYRLNTTGMVDKIQRGEHIIDLPKPIMITAINMSATGILIKTDSKILRMDDIITVDITAHEQVIRFESQIIRAQNATITFVEYACKILTTYIR